MNSLFTCNAPQCVNCHCQSPQKRNLEGIQPNTQGWFSTMYDWFLTMDDWDMAPQEAYIFSSFWCIIIVVNLFPKLFG